jgi:hypothetical protein
MKENFTSGIDEGKQDKHGEACFLLYSDNKCKPHLGDKLRIRFKLDNPELDLIECSAIVRNSGERVGVEFVDLTYRVRRMLGFYFYCLNSQEVTITTSQI